MSSDESRPLLGHLTDQTSIKQTSTNYGIREDGLAGDNGDHPQDLDRLESAGGAERQEGVNVVLRWLGKHRVTVIIVIIAVLAWPVICWATIYWLFADHQAVFPSSLQNANSTLLVVAHPDDECLFFTPTLMAAGRRGKGQQAVLVMSSGNYYGKGNVRKEELMESCRELGIREERCVVVDVPSLRDNPHEWWPVETISRIVNDYINLWKVDSLVTFDADGLSGHINHRTVSAAVTELALSLHYPTPTSRPSTSLAPILFTINTVSLLPEYGGLYNLPLSFAYLIPSLLFGPSSQSTLPLTPPYDASTKPNALESEKRLWLATKSHEKGLLVSGWDGYRTARRAFQRHKSQVVWDRHLFMAFSQYMYFNTVRRVV